MGFYVYNRQHHHLLIILIVKAAHKIYNQSLRMQPSKYLRILGNCLITLCIISSFYSCNKDSSNQNEPAPVPMSRADSVVALTNRWQLWRDSLSNIGNYYYMENGSAHYPIAGVYSGTTYDFYHFMNGGILSGHENGLTFNTTYVMEPGNIMRIQGFLAHGVAYIFRLNQTELVLNWINTSPNGGQYYRRLYLKR